MERSEMKQLQGLWLLPFPRNDCKYFCPITYRVLRQLHLWKNIIKMIMLPKNFIF